MATTVFPQTDDTVARTAWQSLNATINRGDDGGTADTDTDLLKFQLDTSGSSATNLTPDYVTTLSLDAGHTYYVRGCLSVEKHLTDTTDDTLTAGIYLGAGLTAYVTACKSNATLSGSTDFLRIDTFTGASDNALISGVRGTNNVTFTNEPVLWVDMIVVADQDAVLSWYYVKAADANSTWFRADPLTYLIATPIKG
jgi:hypothetical protein